MDPVRICVHTTILQMSKFKTKDKKGKGEFNSILQKETAQNARGDAQWSDFIFISIVFSIEISYIFSSVKYESFMKFRYSEKATKFWKNLPKFLALNTYQCTVFDTPHVVVDGCCFLRKQHPTTTTPTNSFKIIWSDLSHEATKIAIL